jgi:pentapeptide MXKDX repeat protein
MMGNLRYAVLAAVAGLSLAACTSSMSQDEMSDAKMSDDKMAKAEMADEKMAEDKMAADKMAGDKMAEDKMAADKMAEDKMAGDMMMPTGVMVDHSEMGDVLTDKMGMALYTFDKDQPGMSNCYDNCAKNWPPLMASSDAKPMGDFTVIERKDGSMQWALHDMPLYTWVKDEKPGDVTGDGVGGVWHVAMPPAEKMMK